MVTYTVHCKDFGPDEYKKRSQFSSRTLEKL